MSTTAMRSPARHARSGGWVERDGGWERAKPGGVIQWSRYDPSAAGWEDAGATRSAAGTTTRSTVATGRMRVWMSERAWDEMTDYGQHVDTTFGSEYRGIGDGFELGGGLFGAIEGNEIVIEAATGRVSPDPTSSSAHYDFDYIDERAAQRAPHQQLVGLWHSHSSVDGNLGPGRAGFARPSSADFKCWNSVQRHSKRSTPILGLILSPVHNEDYGWMSPRATCVIARGEDGVRSNWKTAEYVPIEVEGRPGRGADLPDGWRL
jgi:hypothetical protein